MFPGLSSTFTFTLCSVLPGELCVSGRGAGNWDRNRRTCAGGHLEPGGSDLSWRFPGGLRARSVPSACTGRRSAGDLPPPPAHAVVLTGAFFSLALSVKRGRLASGSDTSISDAAAPSHSFCLPALHLVLASQTLFRPVLMVLRAPFLPRCLGDSLCVSLTSTCKRPGVFHRHALLPLVSSSIYSASVC